MKGRLLNLVSLALRGLTRLKRLFLILGLIVLSLLFLAYLLKLIEPSSDPQNILVSNITDRQATVSWTTTKATRGIVILSEDGNFPLLPIFTKTYKDDGEKKLSRQRFYTTHHVTAGGLNPNKRYKFLIYQGWKKMIRGEFATGPILSAISAPNPVYGRVISSKKTPLVGALIYLQAETDRKKSAVLSTITNAEGRWNLDLGNLRTGDLKLSYKIATSSVEMVLAEGANQGRGKAFTKSGKDQPWPDIIIK